jgi:hypothetical protein
MDKIIIVGFFSSALCTFGLWPVVFAVGVLWFFLHWLPEHT